MQPKVGSQFLLEVPPKRPKLKHQHVSSNLAHILHLMIYIDLGNQLNHLNVGKCLGNFGCSIAGSC